MNPGDTVFCVLEDGRCLVDVVDDASKESDGWLRLWHRGLSPSWRWHESLEAASQADHQRKLDDRDRIRSSIRSSHMRLKELNRQIENGPAVFPKSLETNLREEAKQMEVARKKKKSYNLFSYLRSFL